MWEGAHFFSDIFLSTAISYFIVDGTYRYMQKNKNNDRKEKKIAWRLGMSPTMLGLHGTF
jgi:hypothetical protein